MFKNNIKIALRNLLRNKLHSIINILGFSISMASFIFIILYLNFELSYDKFHNNCDNIYRIDEPTGIWTPSSLATRIKEEMPEVVEAIRIDYYTQASKKAFTFKDKIFNENKFFLVDPEFFDLFSFELISGNAKSILNEPGSIIISESVAKKYFGKENAIGKVLKYENEQDYIVKGILANIPENTHFQIDLLASYKNLKKSGNVITYLQLDDNVSPESFLDKLDELDTKRTGKTWRNSYQLQKVTDIHLKSHIRGEISINGNLTEIYLFSAIALIILLIACINYMNLATARYIKRIKEVSIRKVVGARKNQLIRQFLGESIIISVIAIIFAVILVEIFLPYINQILERNITLYNYNNILIIGGLILFAIITGLISGCYPAFFLSSIKVQSLIKGINKNKLSTETSRKILVIFQFSLTIFFIIFTLSVKQQMKYIRNKDMGFSMDKIINIPINDSIGSKHYALKDELLMNPGISEITFSNFRIGENNWYQSTTWEGMEEGEQDMMCWIPVDYDFINTFKLEITKGNNFSQSSKKELEYIINESAEKHIGWDDPIGKEFEIVGKGKVIGVVKDFNYKSLYTKVEPCVLVAYPEEFNIISLKMNEYNNEQKTRIKKVWESIIPEKPCEPYLFADNYYSLYQSEQKTDKTMSTMVILTIIISCMGLFGLTSFITNQRTKEIGIRKAIGASVSNIILMLSKEFAILVIISNIIAWPFAYFVIKKWLMNYEYNISISIFNFIIPGIIVMILALLTVYLQSIKAANTKPVDTLRHE